MWPYILIIDSNKAPARLQKMCVQMDALLQSRVWKFVSGDFFLRPSNPATIPPQYTATCPTPSGMSIANFAIEHQQKTEINST